MPLSLAELIRLLPPAAPAPPALPTGIAALDAALAGGGLPRGRLTEMVGEPGSGKTTLTRAFVEATVAEQEWVAWIDAQRTLDPRDWTHLGDEQGVWMIRPQDPSRAAWCADILLRSSAFALVVLDGAPLLTRGTAVRLTRLAKESNAAFLVLGDARGGATQLGGAVRFALERRRPRSSGAAIQRSSDPHQAINVRIEKGGILKSVEVSCAIGVARRLCTYPEIPDRRGVARGPAGDSGTGAVDAQLPLPFLQPSDPSPSPLHSRHATSTTPSPTPDHWDDVAIALTEGANRTLRAVSAEAGRAGVRAGMRITEARALCANLHELAWDDVAINASITEMSALLVNASPQVTPVAGTPGLWWVGASGFDGIGGERALAHELLRIAKRWHPRPRVAIAGSCVAARAATWAGASFQRSGDERSLMHVVAPGHDAEYLSSAPLALVPMEEELREALQTLGLRTVGALAALAAEDVERRWGDIGLRAWRLAHADDPRRPVLARAETHPAVEVELGAPAATMEPVLFIVRSALDRLTQTLITHGRAIAAVAITLTLDDARGALPNAPAHTVTREARMARPMARVLPLFERCRALLDSWTLDAPVSAVRVAIVAAAPLSGEQGDLLNKSWRDFGAADAAIERLRAELGPGSCARRHRTRTGRRNPACGVKRGGAGSGERAIGTGTANDVTQVAAPARDPRSPFPAPLALVRDEPPVVNGARRALEPPEVADVLCNGEVPAVVTWRGKRIAVTRAIGPERLSGDWWDDGYRRDYWRCESGMGEVVVFLDRSDDAWRVQTWMD